MIIVVLLFIVGAVIALIKFCNVCSREHFQHMQEIHTLFVKHEFLVRDVIEQILCGSYTLPEQPAEPLTLLSMWRQKKNPHKQRHQLDCQSIKYLISIQKEIVAH